MKYLIFYLFLFGALFPSCSNPIEKTSEESGLVDIEELINSQLPAMTDRKSVTKSVQIGNEKESQQLQMSEEDWRKELQFFYDSNINKKRWADYFSIDTLTEGNQKHIIYTTDSEKVPVKKCEVRFDKSGDLISIDMRIRRYTAISDMQRRLLFAFPDSIVISNWEKFRFLQEHDVRIMYSW